MKGENFKELWDREEFREILNKRLPLNKNGTSEDKRRSDEWTERKIRTYFSGKSALPEPIREGKKVFYNEEHLLALQDLLNIQEIGLSYRTSTNLYSTFSRTTENSVVEKEKEVINLSNSSGTKRDDIFSLLNGMKQDGRLEASVVSNTLCVGTSGTLRGLSKSTSDVSVESFNKYKIGVDIEISIKNNMNIEDAKKDIQEWLNNLK